MNLQKIINLLDIDKIDQDEVKNTAGRRSFFKQAGDFSMKAAMASLPIALTLFPKTVKAQTSTVL